MTDMRGPQDALVGLASGGWAELPDALRLELVDRMRERNPTLVYDEEGDVIELAGMTWRPAVLLFEMAVACRMAQQAPRAPRWAQSLGASPSHSPGAAQPAVMNHTALQS